MEEDFELAETAPNRMGMTLCVGDIVVFPVQVSSSSRLKYGILKEIRRYQTRNGNYHKLKIRCINYTGIDEGYDLADRDSVILNCENTARISPNYLPTYPVTLLYTHYSDYLRSLT